jgi:hypothetical protein
VTAVLVKYLVSYLDSSLELQDFRLEPRDLRLGLLSPAVHSCESLPSLGQRLLGRGRAGL